MLIGGIVNALGRWVSGIGVEFWLERPEPMVIGCMGPTSVVEKVRWGSLIGKWTQLAVCRRNGDRAKGAGNAAVRKYHR